MVGELWAYINPDIAVSDATQLYRTVRYTVSAFSEIKNDKVMKIQKYKVVR